MPSVHRENFSRRGALHHRYLQKFLLILAIALYHSLYSAYVSRLITADKTNSETCEKAGAATEDQYREKTEPAGDLPFGLEDWDIASNNDNFDIGIPIKGQDKKLVAFATFLGSSIRKFRQHKGDSISFRLIVTRYPYDNATSALQTELAEKSYLPRRNVVFASVVGAQFQRAVAVNVLHKKTKHEHGSVLAVIDVDFQVAPNFFVNTLNFVSVGRVYFPIFFSQFRPSTVKLVETLLGPLRAYHEHRGLWRDFSFGMYALSGRDAKSTLMDERFIGWGGEDNDFYARVQGKNMTIVREKEYGLVHVWHPKYCDVGSFVSQNMSQRCRNSRDAMEGSAFGKYVLNMSLNEPSYFDTLLKARPPSGKSDMAKAIAMRKSEYTPGKDPLEDMMPNKKTVRAARSVGRIGTTRISKREDSGRRILISVISSRRTFKSRVAAILSTWGNETRVPRNVSIRYFVGALESSESYQSGSAEDISRLATAVGVNDLSSIVVVEEVVESKVSDFEKTAAILARLSKIIRTSKRNALGKFEWVLSVHDDTYVNLDALLGFVEPISNVGLAYLGRRANGLLDGGRASAHEALSKPYCMGGPGILFSRPMVTMLARKINKCSQLPGRNEMGMLNDMLIGTCIQNEIDSGCGDDIKYDESVFVHYEVGTHKELSDSALSTAVSLHPIVGSSDMYDCHEQILRLRKSI